MPSGHVGWQEIRTMSFPGVAQALRPQAHHPCSGQRPRGRRSRSPHFMQGSVRVHVPVTFSHYNVENVLKGRWRLLKKAVLCIVLAVVALAAVSAALPALQPEAEESIPAHAQRTAELGLILLDEDNGLFALAITEYSPAWRAGFQAGDLLLSAGDTPLTSVLQLEAMISSASGEVPVLLDRSGTQMILMLPTY